MKTRTSLLALVLLARVAWGQGSALPAGLSAPTRAAIEAITDSARASGLPVAPLHAKVAEGRLKQATDPQIIAAVRGLAGRFRAIRDGLGGSLDDASMTAAATALAVGIPMASIRDMRDAAAGSRTAAADLAGALVTATDLVAQRVSPASAAAAVQSLLARRASPEQFARLRADVGQGIAGGGPPDLATRRAMDAIVRALPPMPATIPPRPPFTDDGRGDPRVSSPHSTMRNPT